jgi:DNA-binding transcriptional MerR regulator
MDTSKSRLLSIGEFAAATQLTPKALRLYDEQGLMRPASTDGANGYRYYSVEQVSTARLIRALRGMGVALSQIATVVTLDRKQGEMLLRELSKEIDQRYADEKRSYYSALSMMRKATSIVSPEILELAGVNHTVSVWSFSCDRTAFVEGYFAHRDSALQHLRQHGVEFGEHVACSLLDPLTNEVGRLELLIPVVVPKGVLVPGVTLKEIPAQRYAAIKPQRCGHAMEFTSAVDALFDWFDRGGYHAIDCPLVSFSSGDDAVDALVKWAFEPARS